MNNSLKKKQMEVEILKITAGKAEQELRIEERLDEIERIKKSIESSDLRIEELKQLLIKIGEQNV